MSNYNFTQSLDGLNNIEADTINTSNLNVGSLVVNTAKITTLSDSNLVNCTSENPVNNNSVVNKTYLDSNFVYKTGSVAENITGLKTFSGTIKTNNYDTNTATTALNIGASNTSGDINIGRNKTSGSINIGSSFGQLSVYCATALNFTSIANGSDFEVRNITSTDPASTNHTLFTNMTTNGKLTIGNILSSNIISGITSFTNNITSSGTLTASIIECGNYRGPSSTSDVFFGTTTTSGQVRLATALNTLGTLLIGSSVGNNTIDGTNLINGLSTFTLTPRVSASTPTLANELIRKDYVDNNFVDRTNNLTQNINGLKTFTNNTTFNTNAIFNSYIQLFSGTNNSYIQQSVADLVITNLFPAGSIYLKTRSLIAGTEDSLKINTTSCDILSPTLNLTSTSSINILSPNNLTGTINLFNTLTTGSINVATSTSTTNLNGSVITNGQLTCNNICPISNTNATLTNHLTTLGFNNGKYIDFTTDQTITGTKRFNIIFTGDHSWRDVGSPFSNRVQSYVSGTSLEFVPQFANNSYNFYCKDSVPTQTNPLSINYLNTTINNNLISNSQATFNNFTPISNIATPTAINHLTRKDYVDNNFLDRTNNLTQNINGLKSFTDDLTTLNIYCNNAVYFRDINLSLKRALIFNQSDVVYFDTSTIYDNYWKFKCFNIEQVVISQLSATFNNKLISLAQARFDNFTPTCTVATPTQINHLTRKDYVDSNFVDKTTAQTGIAGDKTFTGIITISNNLVSNNLTASVLSGIQNIYTTLTSGSIVNIGSSSSITNLNSSIVNLNSSSTINILSPNNLIGVINLLSTLTTATINFCSTSFTSIFNLNARLAHKQVQYMNEVKTISGTSIALVFPLEQSWMFTSTGATAINVTLPELTASYQAGFNFIIFKTASNTNSVTFTRSGTNTIRGLNSITDVTSVTRLSGTNSVGVGFYTAEVSTGNFAWISY